jgi:Tfp pilus assembly protein PilO
MSEPTEARQRSIRAEQLRRRISQLRATRRGGMFGVAELIGVSASLLMLLLVVLSYFYFLLPAQSRLSAQQRERERLSTMLRTSGDTLKKDEDAKQIVERITGSLEEFELRRLVNQSEGRMDLYDELNELIRKNGLRNTSGPTYTTLEPAGSKAAKKTTVTKWQSVYPGIAVAVTVEGQYQNIRHFIRDLETSKQFVVINGVELERATETNAPVSAEGVPATARGALVSLRLDLATYFKRTAADVDETVNGEQKQ